MSEKKDQITEPTINSKHFFKSTRKRLLEVAVITLLSIGILGGAGWLLDSLLNTKPIFFFIFIVMSFVVTQYLLAKRIRKYTDTLISKK